MSDATYNTTGLMMAACPPPAFQPALVVSAKLIGDYQRFFGWPFLLATWLAFGLGKLDCDRKSQEMKAMRLTRNEAIFSSKFLARLCKAYYVHGLQ
jgi:hypothetical protein